MTSLIPLYSNPCMAQTKNRSTVYLVGSSGIRDSALHVHIIDIANISAPVVERSVSSVSSESASWENYAPPWNNGSPKKCTTFLDTSPAFNDTLFINQIGINTWTTMFYPVNGTITRPMSITDVAFISKQAYSFVGQARDSAWTLALNNQTFREKHWSFAQWRIGISPVQFINVTTGFAVNPLLTVGTYTVGPSAPANGHFIIFDKLGGTILPTISNDINTANNTGVIFREPGVVDMSEIKLTADAFYTNMETGAYLLDKAQDGTVSTYYINPSISNTLHRIPTPKKVPRFSSGMAAAAAGSKIVLYSATDRGTGQLHMLNTETNEWSGPDLVVTPLDPTPPEQGQGDQGDTSTNLGAIGGTVGGITLLAVGVLLFVRHRRRRRNSKNNSGNDNISKNSSSNDSIANGKNHASHIIHDKDIRPTELNARSPEGEPLPRKHPQFPAGAPLGYGHAYGYNFGQDRDLAVPLAGPQVISPNLQYYGSPEGEPLPGKNPQFPAGTPLGYEHAYGYNFGQDGDLAVPLTGPQAISPNPQRNESLEGAPLHGRHLQFPPGAPPWYGHAYRYNFGHDGDLRMPLAGPQAILSNPQRYGSAMVPAQSNAYHDYISPNIDRTHQEPPRQPLQAFADGGKGEIDKQPH